MVDDRETHMVRVDNLQNTVDLIALLDREAALSGYPGLAGPLATGETGSMKPPPDPNYRHRFPADVIRHAVWLYHVFSLSLRD
jgi:hypothetical protein